VNVEQAFGTQAVDGLSRGNQADLREADPYLLLLLTIDVGRRGHAGPISLAHISSVLTCRAITLES